MYQDMEWCSDQLPSFITFKCQLNGLHFTLICIYCTITLAIPDNSGVAMPMPNHPRRYGTVTIHLRPTIQALFWTMTLQPLVTSCSSWQLLEHDVLWKRQRQQVLGTPEQLQHDPVVSSHGHDAPASAGNRNKHGTLHIDYKKPPVTMLLKITAHLGSTCRNKTRLINWHCILLK